MPKCDCPSAGVPTFDCVRCGARGTASPRPSGETPAPPCQHEPATDAPGECWKCGQSMTPAPPVQVTPEAKSQSAAVTRESAASGSTLSPAPPVPVGERKPIEHDLKVAPEFFDALASGAKRFELRKADRDFRVWDTMRLREWEGDYTGREHRVFISYVLSEGPWLVPGYACLGIAPLPALRPPSPEPPAPAFDPDEVISVPLPTVKAYRPQISRIVEWTIHVPPDEVGLPPAPEIREALERLRMAAEDQERVGALYANDFGRGIRQAGENMRLLIDRELAALHAPSVREGEA
jgi:hypothetical protein